MKKISFGIKKFKALFLGLIAMCFMASTASAQVVSYDQTTQTTTWDVSVFVTEIMKGLQAGLSILMVFLPIALGVGWIILYAKKK